MNEVSDELVQRPGLSAAKTRGCVWGRLDSCAIANFWNRLTQPTPKKQNVRNCPMTATFFAIGRIVEETSSLLISLALQSARRSRSTANPLLS